MVDEKFDRRVRLKLKASKQCDNTNGLVFYKPTS